MLNTGSYAQALDNLSWIAAYTAKGSENERALVVHSIAIASKLAYRSSLYHAARVLALGARYAHELDERREIVELARGITDMALAQHDYAAAHEGVTALNACARPGTSLQKEAVALALRVGQEQRRGRPST